MKEGASDGNPHPARCGFSEDGTISVGLDVCDGPESGDADLEQDGLHIFVEDALREPLEGRTLDVRIEEESPRFIFS